MAKSKLGNIEAIMLVLTVVVTHTISSRPRAILLTTKSASIINIIIVSTLAILASYFIVKLFKPFPGNDIIDISEYLGGKAFRNIVGIVFIIYFVVNSSILLRNFCESFKLIYYPLTNIFFIITMFIIAICIANRLDLNASIKTNVLILPTVLASIVFLFVANINRFNPQNVYPILGDGFFYTFILGLKNIASFGGVAYIYFLPPILKEPENMKKISLVSIFLSAIYLLLCVSTLLLMFSLNVTTNEIVPLYYATRYIEFGNFIQRLESIFLFIWILIFACYLGIVLKFSLGIFKKITHIETEKSLLDLFGILILSIALVPKNFGITDIFESKIYPCLVIRAYLRTRNNYSTTCKLAEKKEVKI